MSDSCGSYVNADDLKSAKESILHIEHVATSKDSNGNKVLEVTDPIRGVNYTNKTLDGLFSDIGFKPANGSFEDGGTLSDRWDVLLYEADGSYYQWMGDLPKVVPAGSTPASSGSVSPTTWVDRTDLTLRSQLITPDSGLLVDDSNVGFQQPFNGAISKSVHDKFLEIVSPLDFGVRNDNTDCTTQWQAFVSYVNSIPNPMGVQVGVKIPSGRYKYSQTLWFTRPVHVYGDGVEIEYTGNSDAIKLGPDGLNYYVMPDGTNNKWYHQTYSIDRICFRGGSTSGCAVRFAWWVVNCYVTNCEFRYFGGNGSWGVVAEYHNWFVTIKDCVFEAHYTEAVAGGPDESITRNFVFCPGFVAKSDGNYADMWATRVLCENNRIYSSSRVRGGISYLLSGWKSRVVGGSSEGMLKDIVLACGIGDVEINNFYMEKNFQPFAGEISNVVQISYTGDAYYNTVKRERPGTTPEDMSPSRLVRRPRINGFYGNFKSDSGLENSFIHVMADKDIPIDSLYVHGCTLIRYTGVLVNSSDVAGNRNWSIQDVNWDGDLNNYRGLIEPVLASKYKPGYVHRIKNLLKIWDAGQLVSGTTGSAPVPNFNYGTSGINAVSDGTGGNLSFTFRDSFTDAAHFYERNLIDMQSRVFNTFCTSPASSQSVMRIEIDLDISPQKLQDTYVMFSFYGKSSGGTYPLSAALRYTPSATTYQGTRSVNITSDAWRRYSIPIRILDLPLGSSLTSAEMAKLLIVFPVGVVFQIEIASLVLNIGGTSYPIRAVN
ncbi:MAG: tail fiber protein [Siphoviridae sp. ctdc_1]|nr:MAG: tail fiber protein [Siphoviridae sp. ctdc_1]